MSDITLRTATKSDWGFVASVTEACMRDYVEQTWGQWRADSPEEFDANLHQIIQCDGDDIGCIALVDEPAVLVVKTLYSLPGHQNRGIGAALMQQIIKNAGAKKSRFSCVSFA